MKPKELYMAVTEQHPVKQRIQENELPETIENKHVMMPTSVFIVDRPLIMVTMPLHYI